MKKATRQPKPVPSEAARDHLFVSYAWEDQAFAKWLALRLTAEGYRVWIDQFKLLGGESYPVDIDIAIKTRTFRMLGLLSRHSIRKPNPLKERTLALNIAKEPGRQGFLIPLNVDGLAATELDWLTSDITFVPFSPSWHKGLTQLLRLLEREGCPKFVGDGRQIVSAVTSNSDIVSREPEALTSNVLAFRQIPKDLKTFIVEQNLEGESVQDAKRDWAYFATKPHRALAFHPPGDDLASWLDVDIVQTNNWRANSVLEGVDSSNIVASLLRKSIETQCRMKGFPWSRDAEAFYFSGALSASVPVTLPSGEKTTVQLSGQRTYFRVGQPKTQYRYRIAVRFTVERNLLGEFSLIARLRFHFTDTNDSALPPTQRQSRRKHVTRSWFNRHWLVRILAVVQYLADEDGLIRVGPDGPEQVILDCSPGAFGVDRAIDELKLEALQEVDDNVPVEEEEEEPTVDREEDDDDDDDDKPSEDSG